MKLLGIKCSKIDRKRERYTTEALNEKQVWCKFTPIHLNENMGLVPQVSKFIPVMRDGVERSRRYSYFSAIST